MAVHAVTVVDDREGRLGPAWRLDDSLTYDFLLHYTGPVSGSAILSV
jgi:hypothetical protein